MIKKIISGLGLGAICMFLGTHAVGATAPSATSTLDTIMTSIISTTVSLATTIFTTYWPYVLVFGIITGLVVIFGRFLHLGKK